MGMFDTIIGGKIRCPYCKKSTNTDFQTKAGYKTMSTYKIGDKFPVIPEKVIMPTHPKDKNIIINGVGFCSECRAFLKCVIYISAKTHKIKSICVYEYTKECSIRIKK